MSDYKNASKKKKCPMCGEWFWGDETVVEELCYPCKRNEPQAESEEG